MCLALPNGTPLDFRVFQHTSKWQKKSDWFDALASMKWDEGDEAAYASEQHFNKAGVVELAKDWFDVLAAMKWDEEDEAAYANDEDIKHEGTWTDFLSKAQMDHEKGAWSPVDTVTALDVNRYSGRWYQVRGAGFRCKNTVHLRVHTMPRPHVFCPCLPCLWCVLSKQI